MCGIHFIIGVYILVLVLMKLYSFEYEIKILPPKRSLKVIGRSYYLVDVTTRVIGQ